MNDGAIKDFVESIKTETEKTNKTYTAIVSRVDREGVVWVFLAGSDKETPTASTSSEVKSGDVVTVQWRNNKLYIGGNYSDPSAGVRRISLIEEDIHRNEQSINNVRYIANIANEAAGYAIQSADGKNTVYHLATAPTGGTYKVGDTWFNSSEGYAIYTWNGTQWVKEELGEDAIADLSITNAKIANGTIQSAKIGSVDVGSLTGGYIAAGHINTAEITIGKSQVTGLNSDLESFAQDITDINSDISDLQDQIDGNITTWFYGYAPTLSNAPASSWTTTAAKDNHLGDLFYDTTTGYAYRFMKESNTYSWSKITDTDVTKALSDAAKAQDTADHKRRVFVATPTPPYDVGDLWTQGSSGDIKKCKTAKAEGANYSASDWELASKYTDDTTANSALNKANGAVATTVSVYYRSTTHSAPSISASTSIGTSATTSNAWEYVMPQPKRDCYFYTCEKYVSVDGTVTFSTVRELSSETYASKWVSSSDNTYIDGGRLYANSVTADQISASSINASNMLTVGSFKSTDSATVNALFNDSIQIGGRNLHKDAKSIGSSWTAQNGTISDGVVTLTRATSQTRIYQMPANGYWAWEVGAIYTASIEAKGVSGGEQFQFACNANARTYINNDNVKTLTTDWKRYDCVFIVTDAGTGSMTYQLNTNNSSIQLRKPKLEIGNKATAWTVAPEDIESDISTAQTTANGANAEEQRIYYRSNSTTSPSAPNSWITSTSTANTTWTTKRMQYDSTYKYLYTCIQRKTVSGVITNTTVLLDDTTTVIDGGNIITGSITANKIESGSLTIGQINSSDSSTENALLNSSIKVGGRNLLAISSQYARANPYGTGKGITASYAGDGWFNISGTVTGTSDGIIYIWFSGADMTEMFPAGEYTFSVESTLPLSANCYAQIYGSNDGSTSTTAAITTSGGGSVTKTFNSFISRIGIIIKGNQTGQTYSGKIRFKLETGNKATTWTPAPEDIEYDSRNNNLLLSSTSLRAASSISGDDVYPAKFRYNFTDGGKTKLLNNTSDLLLISYDWSISGVTLPATGTNAIRFYPQIMPTTDGQYSLTNIVFAAGTTGNTSAVVYPDTSHTSGHVEVLFRLHSTQAANVNKYLRFRLLGMTGGTLNLSNVVLSRTQDGDTRQYVTEIGSSGIWVTPPDSKPTNPSTGAGATGARIYGDGMQIYQGGAKKASYGATQYIYGGNGTYPLVNVNGTDVKIMKSEKIHADITSSGLEIYRTLSGDESVKVATIGAGFEFTTLRGWQSLGDEHMHLEAVSSGGDAKIDGYTDDYNILRMSINNDDCHLQLGAEGGATDRGYFKGRFNPATPSTSTSNGYYLGDSNNKWRAVYASNGTIQTSDKKYKDVIGNIDFAKDLIMGLEPVEYQWKESNHKRTHMGLIAQDSAEVAMSLGKDLSFYEAQYIDDSDYHGEETDDVNLMWSMKYDELIAPLIKVVQEQQTEIDELKQRIIALEGR